MRHLSDEALQALRAGNSEVVDYFRAHLDRPCEECERFLGGVDGPGILDGRVDQALLALAPAGEPALDEVGFRRLSGKLAPSRIPRLALGVAAAAVVAVVAGGVGLWPGVRVGVDTGVKGGPQLVVELAAAVHLPDGSLRRLENRATAPAGGTVVFRYHATEGGKGLLFRQMEGRPEPELLGSFALRPGTHDLGDGEGLAGVRLDGQAAAVRFVLVSTPGEALDLATARSAMKSEAARQGAVTLSTFDIRIEPRQDSTPP